MTTGGYYAWKKRGQTKRQSRDADLLDWIRKVHTGRRRAYGSPRVYRLLRKLGVTCSRRRVSRVMRENGIRATSYGLYRNAPNRRAIYEQADNLIAQSGCPIGINQQWVADFTYIKTTVDGWCYLAIILDRHSRKVVGWSFSKERNSRFTKAALKMALRSRNPPKGLIFHTDRGIEYVSSIHQEALLKAKLRPSMSGKGRCLDNAHAESFFYTLKTEELYQRKYKTHKEIRRDIVKFIDFYNRERLHSSLDYMSPMEYENRAA